MLSGTCSALLRNPDVEWADIPNLPKAAAAILDEQFSRCTSKVSMATYLAFPLLSSLHDTVSVGN